MTRLFELARVGLVADSDLELPPAGWGDHLWELGRQSMSGLLLDAWHRGLCGLTDDERRGLSARHEAALAVAVLHEAELLRLRPVLDELGAVVIKGPALAHGAYSDPSSRTFTDLDIVVMPRDLRRAVIRFSGYGYRRFLPDAAPGVLGRSDQKVVLGHPSGLVLDLHPTLVYGSLGDRVDLRALLDDAIDVDAGDVRVPAPRWEHHLVVACLHAVVGHGLERPMALRDVVQVADNTDVDLAEAVEVAELWGVGHPVALAVRGCSSLLRAELPDPLARWAAARRPSAREHRAESVYLQPGPARNVGVRFMTLRRAPLRRRLALARTLVAPSPAYLRMRYDNRSLPNLYARRWRDLYAGWHRARKTP